MSHHARHPSAAASVLKSTVLYDVFLVMSSPVEPAEHVVPFRRHHQLPKARELKLGFLRQASNFFSPMQPMHFVH
ncbi:MAG TPA: hypothetical protein VFG51_00055 [Candidatus Saccharimonadia bacterium]|nr:hypothetical protein [Candidatus Saccharimonadia bacterium]